MAAKVKCHQPNVAFGVFLIVLASVALYEIRELGSGTAAEMGAGFVPRALCLFLLAVGAGYAVLGFLQRKCEEIPAIKWKSFLLVFAAIASFALTLEFIGLFGATIIMTVLASFANEKPKWLELVVFSLFLAGLTVLVFIVGLALPLPIWPAFIGQ